MTNIPRNEPVFQISVVSRMVGLHQQTIRSYERVGLVSPARSRGNTRLYSTADVERLRQVIRLVSDLGVNLAGVDVILRMSRQMEELQGDLASLRGEVAQLRDATAATSDAPPDIAARERREVGPATHIRTAIDSDAEGASRGRQQR